MNSAKPETVITATSTTFFRLFCTGRFTVPWHQRHYDWKSDHVDELLHDFADAITAERRCYFLGTVILVQSVPGHWRINDGQQRMVTLSLICARLLRMFNNHNDSHRAHMALRVLFAIDEHSTDVLDTDRLTPRLTPPRDDKTRYNLMISWPEHRVQRQADAGVAPDRYLRHRYGSRQIEALLRFSHAESRGRLP